MYDVIIIGGGPAGLASALTLGRALKTTLVIDNDNPRNKVTEHSHAFLTQDGVTPSTLRQNAQHDVDKYADVERLNDTVIDIKKIEQYFEVQTLNSTFKARKIMICTGLKQQLPHIDGIEACYGKSVFYCPWCDGYELKDQSLIVSVPSEHITFMAKLVSNWVSDIIMNPSDDNHLTQEDIKYLQNKNIQLINGKIKRFEHDNGQLSRVIFEDGKTITRSAGLVGIELDSHFEFLTSLNLKRADDDSIDIDEFGETSVKGVFVAGESSTIRPSQLIDAASSGNNIAKFVAMQIIDEDDIE
ncbi:NAD(P)/FAD-dependent oxidoreductase [Staphylococcus simiae]|uniref:Thioredoxin reductase n=1 Tax=Staphylococcus simiae CCM 7213 = CCUG 51256 TaxID=911238 RepID=G5JFD1_9STAP|nr:NAD(P)/FAD-dependent oxidoreductase [Staphylococcus simiae]EHJ09102.1 Thioredoxin reductase [Staphylococcus simiae CCM 7213 = CCUG 51256]PNZ14207.1 NAD(P)/FAD-dependent oxidoreductase [Staphylococcus simiae]SNV72448.1 thioredoxin reductase [Staphylococcus simiae]